MPMNMSKVSLHLCTVDIEEYLLSQNMSVSYTESAIKGYT